MNKFIMMCGLPGSGKSWEANNILNNLKLENKNDPNYRCEILSSDKYREMLLGDENCQNNNQLVFNSLHKDLIYFLEQGYDVIYDATNTTLKSRLKVLKLLKDECLFDKIEKTCCIVNTPFFICVDRDKSRNRQVGYHIVKKFLHSFQCPQYFEGWDYIVINELPENNWCDYKSINQVLEEMNNFDQSNPHHIYSLGEHCRKVFDNFYSQGDEVRAQAGLFHDIGKLHTQHFDEYGIAHYYNHDSVGAYQILCHLEFLPSSLNINEKLDVIFYINYHMRAHKDFRNFKAYKKYSEIFGKYRLDRLIEFADADIEASGTKDCHEEVMKKIEEMKNK